MSTWIPISERMPTREETNGHEQASQIKRLTTLLNRTHIVLGMLTDDMHDEDIPPQARALIADVRRIVREELARTPPQGQGEKQT